MSPSTLPRLLICADDLTGANDIGAQFAKHGISAVVVINPASLHLPSDAQVVVVNTESRHLPPAEAAERVRTWVALGRSRGVTGFYKKTDSTLRGNVGAELEALALATGAPVLPFTPALPELGRTTRAGLHYVHGQPLHESPFAHDPLNPIRTSSVAEILQSQCSLPVHYVGTPDALEPSHSGIVIFDAENAADIDRIGASLAERNLLRVCAGPAGFGMQLAKRLDFTRAAGAPIECRGPVLVVNGSVNERSLRQIVHSSVTSRRLGRFQMSPDFLLAPASDLPNLLPAQADAALTRNAGHLLLFSVASREELPPFLAQADTRGMDASAAHRRVARNTGMLVRELLATQRFATLVVFGGDTLMGIARANGWTSLTPLTEVMDGITVARPEGSPLTLISKAGGFGADDVLARVLAFVEKGCGSTDTGHTP